VVRSYYCTHCDAHTDQTPLVCRTCGDWVCDECMPEGPGGECQDCKDAEAWGED